MIQQILVHNAKIYDGSGSPPFLGSITISNGKFLSISHKIEITANSNIKVIDAKGLSVAPGFIDVHAHSDLTLLTAPTAFSKVSQGVTTEINGNCGHSMFPVTSANYDYINTECNHYGFSCKWNSLEEYQTVLKNLHPSLRTFFFCGHNTLVSAYPKENTAQADALKKMIQQGALGLSSGLLYAPGRNEPFSNLINLMKVLRDTNSLYVTHLRSEGNHLQEALKEAIHLARFASNRLHISHLKTAGKENWHKLSSILEYIHSAQQDGITITADRYPYTYSQTSFSVVLPSEYDSMRDIEIQFYLSHNPEECQRLSMNTELNLRVADVILTASSKPEYELLLGKTISHAAKIYNVSPAQIAIQILRDDASTAMAAFPGMSSDNLQTILNLPFVCCGSDENATPIDNSLGRGHPRRFGSFPLFIRQIARTFSMTEAIRRVTALPAEIFHLPMIGHIRPGYYADFVIFNENLLDSHADFVNPHTPAEGILLVCLAGRPVFGNIFDF